MKTLSKIWDSIQSWLLPELREEIGELSEPLQQFVAVCEVAQIDRFSGGFNWRGVGRPPHDRLSMLKCFVLKAVLDLKSTRALIDYVRSCPQARRLCGYETVGQVPDESTFSRAFAAFAASQLPSQIHAAMIATHLGEKLVGHISRDSTAIEARERPAPKPAVAPPPASPPPAPKPLVVQSPTSPADLPVAAAPPSPPVPAKRRPGRPRKGEVRPPPPPRRVPQQLQRSLADNLADLPTRCDAGAKRNSQGHLQYWRGYKLHADIGDGDVPISAILTSASLHDSQAAIPLAQMSAQRVTSLYDLMDAAYDVTEIRAYCRQLGHEPLIDHSPKGKTPKRPFAPAEARRFAQRSSAERFNSHLDNHGRHTIRVRGPSKVHAHLMFGVLVIAAEQLLRMLP